MVPWVSTILFSLLLWACHYSFSATSSLLARHCPTLGIEAEMSMEVPLDLCSEDRTINRTITKCNWTKCPETILRPRPAIVPIYIKLHRKHLSPDALDLHQLPWEWDEVDDIRSLTTYSKTPITSSSKGGYLNTIRTYYLSIQGGCLRLACAINPSRLFVKMLILNSRL